MIFKESNMYRPIWISAKVTNRFGIFFSSKHIVKTGVPKKISLSENFKYYKFRIFHSTKTFHWNHQISVETNVNCSEKQEEENDDGEILELADQTEQYTEISRCTSSLAHG